ncbi:hypothetical protein ES705_24802 [subsurface metagenome]
MAVPASWDFQDIKWELNTDIYVSSPSSLHLLSGRYHWNALCKNAGTLDIEQGQLIDHFQANIPISHNPGLFFRAQAPVGQNTPVTFYCAAFYTTYTRVYRYINGTPATFLTFTNDISLAAATWYLIRITWWWAYDKQNVKSTAIRIERWNGDAWVDWGTQYDTGNIGDGTGINRVGVGRHSGSTYATTIYHDDTEIWTPSE